MTRVTCFGAERDRGRRARPPRRARRTAGGRRPVRGAHRGWGRICRPSRQPICRNVYPRPIRPTRHPECGRHSGLRAHPRISGARDTACVRRTDRHHRTPTPVFRPGRWHRPGRRPSPIDETHHAFTRPRRPPPAGRTIPTPHRAASYTPKGVAPATGIRTRRIRLCAALYLVLLLARPPALTGHRSDRHPWAGTGARKGRSAAQRHRDGRE